MTASTTPRTTSPRRRIATLERRTATTTADAPARNLTEAQFQRQVTDLLTLYNWRWCHFPDSRRVQGYPGMPDIIAVRDGRVMMIELKAPRGRVRQEQREWLNDLRWAGVEAHVWWASSGLEHIKEALR